MKNLVKIAIAEWTHLIDPQRRKRKFHLVDNWITMHEHARWIALGTYLLGSALIGLGYILTFDWSVVLMMAGLVIWTVPVMWIAYKWSHDA